MLPKSILGLLTEKQLFQRHLDDTLLNRLEACLYCLDSNHSDFWKDITKPDFICPFTESFAENFQDENLYRGVLKLKFAIFWKLRNVIGNQISPTICHIIADLLQSNSMTVFTALSSFLNSLSNDPKYFQVLKHLDSSEVFPILRKSFISSNNINHKRMFIKSFAVIFVSKFKNPCVHLSILNELGTFITCKDNIIQFNLSFFSELHFISRLGGISLDEAFFPRHVTILADYVIRELQHLKDDDLENALFLLYLLNNCLSDDLKKHMLYVISNLSSDVYAPQLLRRIMIDKLFQESELTSFFVEKWYQQATSALNNPSKLNFRKIISPVATCHEDLSQFHLFQKHMPPNFISKLWCIALVIFDKSSNTSDLYLSNICWTLFMMWIPKETDDLKLKQLGELLNKLTKHVDAVSSFGVLIDVFFKLHSNLLETHCLEIFDSVYILAESECNTIVDSGGTLFFSFLLLRLFDIYYLKREYLSHICTKMINLQALISIRICEEQYVVCNETIVSIQRGLFIAKVLNEAVLDETNFQKIVQLVIHLQEIEQKLSNQVFPGTLKGILLASLLHCFTVPRILNHITVDHMPYFWVNLFEICTSLLTPELEEDPSIRIAVNNAWINLNNKTGECSNEFLKYFLPIFREKTKFCAFVQNPIDDEVENGKSLVCSSCRECMKSLLEDIIIARHPAGAVDCIGD